MVTNVLASCLFLRRECFEVRIEHAWHLRYVAFLLFGMLVLAFPPDDCIEIQLILIIASGCLLSHVFECFPQRSMY